MERIDHVPPSEHAAFYAASRFTLNVTRADMIRAGYSPSVRLFEAAACGTPIISDIWDGIDTLFAPGREIVLAADGRRARGPGRGFRGERRRIGEAARRRVLAEHTAAHRAGRSRTSFFARPSGGARRARPPDSVPDAKISTELNQRQASTLDRRFVARAPAQVKEIVS